MKKRYFHVSKAARLVRFVLFGKHLGIQFPVLGRSQWFYKYNDGETAFVDFGPLRLYRHFWRERLTNACS